MKQLTKTLKLTSIQENNFQAGKIKAVICYFEFFEEEGEAWISLSELDSEEARYGITEISEEISDSFNYVLEKEEIWQAIVSEVKEFVKKWEADHSEEN